MVSGCFVHFNFKCIMIMIHYLKRACCHMYFNNACLLQMFQFTCPELSTSPWRHRRCIPRHFLCDRRNHCPQGSDEVDCTHTCPEGQFLCNTGETMSGFNSTLYILLCFSSSLSLFKIFYFMHLFIFIFCDVLFSSFLSLLLV